MSSPPFKVLPPPLQICDAALGGIWWPMKHLGGGVYLYITRILILLIIQESSKLDGYRVADSSIGVATSFR